MEQKTPLYDRHVALGGKIVPFAGYLLPVQYGTGVIAEHMAVRERAGLFDVSHMGEVVYTGEDALANLNMVLTNDFTSLAPGQVRYSPMCNQEGGVVDDLIVYCQGPQRYLVVVNASNRHKDVAWMKAQLFGSAKLEDISDQVGQLALQGPRAQEILEKLVKPEDLPAKYYTFTAGTVGGWECLISRTGYTGEDGFELYTKSEDTPALWDLLLEAGQDLGLIPCGLGARDTLRLEASMPLYGHEMDDIISPLETGLGFAVKLAKPDFVGKAALEARGTPRKRVGLEITGRGIAREHEPVYLGDQLIGHTTSGTHCPFLGHPVAMALVDAAHAQVDTVVQVEVRGRRIEAKIIPLPFYKRK